MGPHFSMLPVARGDGVVGDRCPYPADVPAGARVSVSLVVETDEQGFVVGAIAVDYSDATDGLLRRWILAHYGMGALGACQGDAVTLAGRWRLPIRRATRFGGWEAVEGGWNPWQ